MSRDDFWTGGHNDTVTQHIEDYWDDVDRAAPEEIEDDTTTRLPIRDSVSVETMVAVIKGQR